MLIKYPVALFVGRFQPLHRGHVWAMEEALKRAEKVIVGIGSSNITDENNPYDVTLRNNMIYKVIEEYGWKGQIAGVIALPDTTDEQWVKNVEREVNRLGFNRSETLVVGSDERVNDLLSGALFPVHETGLYKPMELEGLAIRRMIRVSDSTWQERVPRSVAQLLQ
jgi:nicotinamide-nucleotide adenylyltransferase